MEREITRCVPTERDEGLQEAGGGGDGEEWGNENLHKVNKHRKRD